MLSGEPCWVQVGPVRANTFPSIRATLPSSDRPPTPGVLSAAPCRAHVPSERKNATPADQRCGPVPRQCHIVANSLTALVVSFEPCWVQTDPARVNTHAAPQRCPKNGPPIKAVSPSSDNATLAPKSPCAASSFAVNGSLLSPGRTRAGEHRCVSCLLVDAWIADQGGVAIP